MTALIAPIALSTRPLFSACSSSIRSSRPLRASTYLRGQGVDHRLLLGVDVALELLELLADLLRRLGADLLQVRGQALHVRRRSRPCPVAIRCLAAVRSLPTMSATREMTPSICLR